MSQKLFFTFENVFHVYLIRNYKNTHEIYLPLWLVEDRPKQGRKGLQDGLDWLCYLSGTSMSHHTISNSCIFLKSPHQVRECVSNPYIFGTSPFAPADFGAFKTIETCRF